MRKRSRRPETWRQSSRAKRRSGPRERAQASSRSWPRSVGRHRELADAARRWRPRGRRRCGSSCAGRSRVRSWLSPFGRTFRSAGPPVDTPWWGPLSQAPIRSRRRTSRQAAGDTTHVGQPRRATATQWVTPPPGRRLPDHVGNPNGLSLTPTQPKSAARDGLQLEPDGKRRLGFRWKSHTFLGRLGMK